MQIPINKQSIAKNTSTISYKILLFYKYVNVKASHLEIIKRKYKKKNFFLKKKKIYFL